MIRKPFRIAALVAATALVAGCSVPGTAATVNGERITDRAVSEFVSDQNRLFGAVSQVTIVDGITSLTFGAVAEPIAEDLGIGVTDDDASTAINDQLASLGLPAVEPADLSDGMIDVYRAVLLANKLQSDPLSAAFSEQLQTALGEAEVSVNPRYGLQGSEGGNLFAPLELPWISGNATL